MDLNVINLEPEDGVRVGGWVHPVMERRELLSERHAWAYLAQKEMLEEFCSAAFEKSIEELKKEAGAFIFQRLAHLASVSGVSARVLQMYNYILMLGTITKEICIDILIVKNTQVEDLRCPIEMYLSMKHNYEMESIEMCSRHAWKYRDKEQARIYVYNYTSTYFALKRRAHPRNLLNFL